MIDENKLDLLPSRGVETAIHESLGNRRQNREEALGAAGETISLCDGSTGVHLWL